MLESFKCKKNHHALMLLFRMTGKHTSMVLSAKSSPHMNLAFRMVGTHT